MREIRHVYYNHENVKQEYWGKMPTDVKAFRSGILLETNKIGLSFKFTSAADCVFFNTLSSYDKLGCIKSQAEFQLIASPIFSCNLIMVDSYFHKILAQILLSHLSCNEKVSPISSLVDLISQSNPLDYELSIIPEMYVIKMKRFLRDCALGMRPDKVWDGKHSANGYSFIVNQWSEQVCYHFHSPLHLESFLYRSTLLEIKKIRFGRSKGNDRESDVSFVFQIRFI